MQYNYPENKPKRVKKNVMHNHLWGDDFIQSYGKSDKFALVI